MNRGDFMPSLYAHHAFGKKVFLGLPDNLKKIIRKYPDAFNAGLLGPDFLFFYRPFFCCHTNKLGHSQHRESLDEFLEEIRPTIQKKGKNCGEYAYLLGFICHFMLDSESHAFVIKKAKEPGYNHLVMEIEFDRYLLKKDGKNPFLYPAWKHIKWNKETLDAIHGIYRSFAVSRKNIEKSLKSMSLYKWFFTTGRTIRRMVIRAIMFISGYYEKLEGHMMDLIPKHTASKTNPILEQIYMDTIPKCIEMLCQFDDAVLNDVPFHDRFHTTFRSNEA